MAAGTVARKDNPRRIPMPFLHIGHDGERGCQCIVMCCRIGVFRGKAGMYREHQCLGAIAQHPHLAVVSVELTADKTAAMKVDQGRTACT